MSRMSRVHAQVACQLLMEKAKTARLARLVHQRQRLADQLSGAEAVTRPAAAVRNHCP